MATKDWAAPLVAAIVTFGGLLALPDRQGDDHSNDGDLNPGSPETASEGMVVAWAFEDPVARMPGRTELLGRIVELPEGVTCPQIVPRVGDYGPGFPAIGTGNMTFDIHCPTPALAMLRIDITHDINRTFLALIDELYVRTAQDGPRLGEAGHNATRVTVHIFDGDGALVASNGNASEQARLGGDHAPQQLPGGVWYLGANETPPSGTQALPTAARALLPQLRGLLAGLPVGGVATTQTDALRGLYGTLYVTAQIDELVRAP